MYQPYPMYPYAPWANQLSHPYEGYPFYAPSAQVNRQLQDHGSNPFVTNITRATKQNRTFRTALWTGRHLQLTLMSIRAGEDIGLEIHPNVDQFLRIEEGEGLVQMGRRRDTLTFRRRVGPGDVILIPAGTWHNLTNTGNRPIKLYSIYAPPEHPFGTVQEAEGRFLRF